MKWVSPKNNSTVNLKSASFVVIMLLNGRLTQVHSQKKPRLHFDESFTLMIDLNKCIIWKYGATKDCESCGMLTKNTCLDHHTGKQVHWWQVIVSWLGLNGAILGSLSRSQASMERGSTHDCIILLHGLRKTSSVATFPGSKLENRVRLFPKEPPERDYIHTEGGENNNTPLAGSFLRQE